MLFPLRDSVKSKTVPYVNITLIVLTAVVFIFQLQMGENVNLLFAEYGFVPFRVFSPDERGFLVSSLLPFFTSIFLHGGFMHIISNMYYLYIFGDNVEDHIGHFNYFLSYLAFGVAANVVHGYFNIGSQVPTIGASGAVSGIMGYYAIMYPFSRINTFVFLLIIITTIEIPAVLYLIIWFYLQFSSALSVGELAGGGVAWWAHVGGFAAGAVLGIISKVKSMARE